MSQSDKDGEPQYTQAEAAAAFEWLRAKALVADIESRRALIMFCEVVKLKAAQSASVPHGKVLVDVQLIRDIQSNAAIGEPEWSSIEDRLLRIGAPDSTASDKGQG